jgi:xanthine dehydrogenase YagR molybdenum-binding subunit
MLARLVYPTPFKRLEDHDVLTHGPPGKPFRAPGGPPAAFALESLVDALAAQRGEDPLALRRRWDPNPNRQRLYTAAERLPLWAARGPAAADRGRFRRGVGLAIGVWIPFVSPGTEVQIDGSADGFVVSIATQDIGTGTRTLLAEGVARVLGVPRDTITVRLGDSRQPRGPMSAGSRTAASVGPAAEDAARAWVDAILGRAEQELGLSDAEPVPGGLSAGGRVYPWSELLGRLPRVTVVGRRGRDPGGYFLPLEVEEIKILNELPGSLLIASVEVDTRLGRTTVREVWAGVAAGRIWSPRLAAAQVEGAVVQGLSYALYEERRRCPRTGALLSRGLEDYRIAGPGDLPPITTHFDTGGFAGVRGGGVGIGELATVPVAAALANAVAHATGWRPTALPLRIGDLAEALA